MNQVERVQATLPNDVLGDMAVVTTYSGYRDFGGIQFPSHIVQTQGGYPTLDLTVTAVQPNVYVDITVPDQVRTAAAPALTATSQRAGRKAESGMAADGEQPPREVLPNYGGWQATA